LGGALAGEGETDAAGTAGDENVLIAGGHGGERRDGNTRAGGVQRAKGGAMWARPQGKIKMPSLGSTGPS
jgi:hypothetical protein